MIYCPSCQSEVAKSCGGICLNCGWKLSPTSIAPEPRVVRPATRPKIQCEVDLAATVDRTGSSKQFETGIPVTYEMIMRQVVAKARSVKCWTASHGDLDEGQDFIIHTDEGGPEQAIEDIKKITYGGGGAPPENHLDAIEGLLNAVPWKADPSRARGAILAFMTADTKPARSGITAQELGAEIKKREILLYLVCEPTPTLHELVDAAEGMMFQISNKPDPKELEKIAAQLAASIVASVSSGKTVPMAVTA